MAGQRGRLDYTRISADCHIDMPWIPPDLFTANAPLAIKAEYATLGGMRSNARSGYAHRMNA